MVPLLLGFIIVCFDQAAKVVIRQELALGESRPVLTGFFNLTYLRNTGAVWGMFQYQNEWLILLSLLVILLIAMFYRWLVNGRQVHRVAMGLMMGGIVGNLIDRIKLGWVTDFLDFHWRTGHWPSFNIADSAICIGVALYLVSSLWGSTPATSSSLSLPHKGQQDNAGHSSTI